MTEIERVLQVLIHDARTPIGVAQGYLRLLQQQRLRTVEEQERAMARSMDALGRLAKLCDDASRFVGEPAETFAVVMPASELVAHVTARASKLGFVVTPAAIALGAQVRIVGGLDHIVEAITRVLGTMGSTPDVVPIVQAETTVSELRFAGVPDGQGPTVPVTETPFDPWRTPGLAVALACRTIAQSAGRVVGRDQTATVVFPLEITIA